MDSYQILKTIHKVGHPITGTVVDYQFDGFHIILKISSEYKVVLPYDYLFDEMKDFDETLLPEIGCQVNTVIKNHVDDTLYVSARPCDLEEIHSFREFYEFIEKNKERKKVEGIVKKLMPFGLFVDIGAPFIGLIDIGHSGFNGGKMFPNNYSEWPKEEDAIKCVIKYYRFDIRQIGLGWIPE